MAKAKTKAQLEQEIDSLHEQLLEAQKLLEVAETPAEEPAHGPARSEVQEGGGTFVGAVLHVRVPARGNASDRPTATAIPFRLLEDIAESAEGTVWAFGENYSLPLADGGYANARGIRVLHQPEPGRTLVDVME